MDPRGGAGTRADREGDVESRVTLVNNLENGNKYHTNDNAEPTKSATVSPEIEIDMEETDVSLKPRVKNLFLPTVAALLAAITILFLIIIIFHDILLTRAGPLSTFQTRIYTTCTTAAATAISWFISNQIKLLWLDEVEVFRKGSEEAAKRKRDALASVSRLTKDSFRFWRVTLTSLVMGLMTTAIVSGVAPGDTTRISTDVIQLDYVKPEEFPETDHQIGWYSWPTGSSSTSFYTIQPDNGRISTRGSISPSQYYQALLNVKITAFDLAEQKYEHIGYSNMAYAQWGFFVSKNAMGASPIAMERLVSGSSVVSGQVCSPVVTANPVKCTATGSVTVHGNNFTVVAGGCNATSPIGACDLADRSCNATVSGVCPGGKVGEVTIVMGSVGFHASRLRAISAKDDKLESPADNTTKWSVACTVSRPQFDFRLLTAYKIPDYSNLNWRYGGGMITGLSYVMSAEQSCSPVATGAGGVVKILNESLIFHEWSYAQAAAASYSLLTENRYADGWWSHLSAAADSIFKSTEDEDTNGPDGTDRPSGPSDSDHQTGKTFNDEKKFPDSNNKLEDALGTINSIGFTRFLTTPGLYAEITPVVSRVAVQKIGSSRWYSLVYTIPILYSLLTLLNLMRRRRTVSLRRFRPLKGQM